MSNEKLDQYIVTVYKDDEIDSRENIMEVCTKNGIIHRDYDEPAIIRRNKESGKILQREWYHQGQLTRGNGKPAIIFDDGDVREEQHFKDGKLHRDDNDLPAITKIAKDTKIELYRCWAQNGDYHRLNDEPAEITCDRESLITLMETYWIEGKLTREGGPAVIERYHDTGITMSEGWWLNDYRHRSDGLPTMTQYHNYTGKIEWTSYHNMGQKIANKDEFDPSP